MIHSSVSPLLVPSVVMQSQEREETSIKVVSVFCGKCGLWFIDHGWQRVPRVRVGPLEENSPIYHSLGHLRERKREDGTILSPRRVTSCLRRKGR